MSTSNDRGEYPSMADQLGELRQEIKGTAAGLRTGIVDSRAELRKGIADFRAELTTLRTETAGSFTEIRKDIASINKALAAAKIWAMTMTFGIAGSILFVIARGLKWI